jgi:hypothetical protein
VIIRFEAALLMQQTAVRVTDRCNALLECRASARNFRRRNTSKFKHFRLMFRNLVSAPLSLISESPSPCLTPGTVHSAHTVHWCVARYPYNEVIVVLHNNDWYS